MRQGGELPRRIPGVSRENATALAEIQSIWRDRYLVIIGRDSGGALQWQAARNGSSATFTITADTAEGLRHVVGEDYKIWQREAREHKQ